MILIRNKIKGGSVYCCIHTEIDDSLCHPQANMWLILPKGFLCVRHILEVIICPLGLRNWDLPEKFRRVKIKVFHSFFLLFLPFIFYFSLISLHFYQSGSMSTMLKKFDLDVIFQTTYYDTRSKLILEIFC